MSGFLGIVHSLDNCCNPTTCGELISGIKNENAFGKGSNILVRETYSAVSWGSEKILSFDSTQNIMVAFVGELYNADVLLADVTDSCDVNSAYPCDIVLRGYEKYGCDIIKRLDGVFSLLLVDNYKKDVLFARDIIGSFPLYYAQNGQALAVSTSLEKLISTGIVEKEIDREALSQYLQLTYIPAPKSIYAGVKKCPAATLCLWNHTDEVRLHEYWTVPTAQDSMISDYNEAKRLLRATVIEALSNRIKCGGRFGTFLSGGFDSTIITGLLSKMTDSPIDTFTVGFDQKGLDESACASLVAKMHKTKHTVIKLTESAAADAINDIFDNIEEPFADSSLIATYFVSKAAKQHIDVAFTGDGGDEVFAGYEKYLIGYYSSLYNAVPKIVKDCLVKPALRVLPLQSSIRRKAIKVVNAAEKPVFEQRKELMSLGFKPGELESLMRDGIVDEMSFIRFNYDRFPMFDEQTRAQYVDLKTVLEGDMLPKVGIAGAMTGLKTRGALLSKSVVELAYQMPSKFKIDKKDKKIILKDTFGDLIPEELFKQPKHGFGVPMSSWIEGFLLKEFDVYCERHFLEQQGLFNYEYIKGMVNSHINHKDNRYSELWAFLVFQEWYSRHF